MTKVIKALIPVRAGSQRVKNKNIRPFSGSSLLEIKIKQMLNIKELDGVIVNSESDEMLDIAKSLGAEIYKREEYYASSTVPINEVYRNIGETTQADIIVYANATNPLLKNESVSSAITAFLNKSSQYDTLNSVHLIKEFMWLNGKPINYELDNMPKSQDLPNIYALNFALNIFEKEYAICNASIVGKQPLLFELDSVEATDIDNEIDFEFAEFMYNKTLKPSNGACFVGGGSSYVAQVLEFSPSHKSQRRVA